MLKIKQSKPASIQLRVLQSGGSGGRRKQYARWRAATLLGVYLLAGLHIAHWAVAGRTLAPMELNELMYTLELGIVTAGFLLMATAMLSVLLFGRFFCSWLCHILALQDLCAWLLGKFGIRPKPVRSRALLLVGPGAMFYMFIWPQIDRLIRGDPLPTLRLLDDSGGWASFVTDDFWRNLPGPVVAGLTFLTCGFLIVYILGSRSFCAYACPYGAVFSIADRLAPGRLVEIDNRCDQCGLCTTVCESHVRVHEEIGRFGMIVDANCLKDLDCVSVCPKDAIGFRFTRPSLLRSFSRTGRRRLPSDFSLAEETMLALVFLVTLAIVRGLYGYGPFLMSLGVAGISGYLSVIALRTVQSKDVRINAFQLKRSGRITGMGAASLGCFALFVAFMAHSGWIRYHEIAGDRDYQRMREYLHTMRQNPPAELVGSAKRHAHAVERWGLLRPRALDARLASLHSFDQPPDVSVAYFERALARRPDDRAERILFAQTLLRLGRDGEAQSQLLAAAKTEPETSHGHAEATRQRVVAAMTLGNLRLRLGDFEGAAGAFRLALSIDPDHPPAARALRRIEIAQRQASRSDPVGSLPAQP
ncbi:MAG: 4Fe-4S binding protein [Phycisphaeraceae bacterium]|nr:4Fe-4S binding protein [Phycisphaeraceae bacterium]